MTARPAIPDELVYEVERASARACCVCGKRGRVIHHVDGDATNNTFDNLVFLCHDDHDEAHQTGGNSRRLAAKKLRRFRDDWYAEVEARRRTVEHAPGPLAEDRAALQALVLETIQLHEVRKAHFVAGNSADWTKQQEFLDWLSFYAAGSGIRVREEAIESLSTMLVRSRIDMPSKVAHSIAHLVIYCVLVPFSIWERRKEPLPDEEVTLMERATDTGGHLAYAGARDGTPEEGLSFTNAGAEVLWHLLRYAQLNDLETLRQKALSEFESALGHARKRGAAFAEFVRLLEFRRQDALVFGEEDRRMHYPEGLKGKLFG